MSPAGGRDPASCPIPPQAGRRGRRRWPAESPQTTRDLVVLLLATSRALRDVAKVHGPLRVVLGFALVVIIPGWSIVGLVRLGDPALESD